MSWRHFLVVGSVVLASAAARAQTKPNGFGQTKGRVKAAEAFAQIRDAGKLADSAARTERMFPAELVAKRNFDQNQLDAWRATFAKEMAAAKVIAAREQGDEAVVRFTAAGSTDERELPLHYAAGNWVVGAAQSYLVKGQSLDDRRGKDVARLTLQARTGNDDYGKSAFSFTHVTSLPDECKNRMDVWYCHNGDLHVGGDNRIADLGSQKLTKVDALPVGAKWNDRTVAPRKGNTYVIHCQQGDRRDFYVKLSVIDVKADAVTIEWTLLSDGLNAPANIANAQPLISRDGADGADGLCSKRGG